MDVSIRDFIEKLQCYFWVVLIAFSTIGCSAKTAMFEGVDIAIEKPLTGSKTLSLNGGNVCVSEIVLQRGNSSNISVQKTLPLSFTDIEEVCDLSIIPLKFELGEDYILGLAGTSPPLYLMFQKIKYALLS